MKKIGSFKRHIATNGAHYFVGNITTLHFETKAVIAPVKRVPNGPDYVVKTNKGTDLGEAWNKITPCQEFDYLIVCIDDPAFTRPLRAVLCGEDKDKNYNLYWNRNFIAEDEIPKLYMSDELIPYLGALRPVEIVTDYLLEIYPLIGWERGLDCD